MPSLRFHAENCRQVQGKSDGLSPGLLASYGSHDLTQEGMGIGSIALKTPQGTYFPASCATAIISPGRILKTFQVDSRLVLCCRGRAFPFLTPANEKIVDFYMRYPALQPFLLPLGASLKRLMALNYRCRSFPPIAEASFVYEIKQMTVNVACRIFLSRPAAVKVYILNELGADFFTCSLRDGHPGAPPSGWAPLPPFLPTPAFYNPGYGIKFLITGFAADPAVPVRIFWGRERSSSLCWAGFALELDLGAGGASEEVGLAYAVEFAEGKET